MATQLYVIANATNYDATFTNTEQAGDKADVGMHAVIHTGGKDGDFVEIPACSESKYFEAHHMSVLGGKITIAFWRDDSEGNILMYSLNNTYASRNSIPGSNNWKYGASMLIEQDSAGTARVNFFPY